MTQVQINQEGTAKPALKPDIHTCRHDGETVDFNDTSKDTNQDWYTGWEQVNDKGEYSCPKHMTAEEQAYVDEQLEKMLPTEEEMQEWEHNAAQEAVEHYRDAAIGYIGALILEAFSDEDLDHGNALDATIGSLATQFANDPVALGSLITRLLSHSVHKALEEAAAEQDA